MTRAKTTYLNRTYKNIGDVKNWIENTFQINDHIVFYEDDYSNNDFRIEYYANILNGGDSNNKTILWCGTYGKCLKWIKQNIKETIKSIPTFDKQFAELKTGDIFKIIYHHDTSYLEDIYIKTDIDGGVHLVNGGFDRFENSEGNYYLEKISDDKKIKMIESAKEL